MNQKAAFGLILFSITGIVFFLAVAHGPAAAPIATDVPPTTTNTVTATDTSPTEASHRTSASAALATRLAETPAEPISESKIPDESRTENATTSVATTGTPAALAQLTIVASGTSTYPIAAPGGTTLIEAMYLLEKDGFAFTSHEYSGMGAFIDSIQGVRNADGYYWILSVNGSKSSLGASSIVLHQDDRIEWRYEKGY